MGEDKGVDRVINKVGAGKRLRYYIPSDINIFKGKEGCMENKKNLTR